MKKTNIFLMILFTIITLSLYNQIWCWKRIADLNKLIDKKISFIFKILLIINIISIILILISNENISKLFLIIDVYLFILIIFRIKNAIREYCIEKDIDIYFSKWLTVIFSIFYLQFKINTIKNFEAAINDSI